MSTLQNQIIENAIELTPQERMRIAQALINSLHTSEASVEKEWIKEVEKTLQAIETPRLSVYGLV